MATGRGVWVAEYRSGAKQRYIKVTFCRVRADGGVTRAPGVALEALLRVHDLLIHRETFSVDAGDGSLWCLQVVDPLKKAYRVTRITEQGAVEPLWGERDTLRSISIDGRRRRLWLAVKTQLALGDLELAAPIRTIDDVLVEALVTDPSTGGAWAVVKPLDQPSGYHHLRYYGPKPGADLVVDAVRAMSNTTGEPRRMLLHPLADGGVVCLATLKRVPSLVRVNRRGEVEASHGPVREPVMEMTAHAGTGEVALVYHNPLTRRPNLRLHGPLLAPRQNIDPPALLDKCEKIYSAAYDSASGDLWVTGSQRLKDPNGPGWIYPGSVGILRPDATLDPISSALQQQRLVRTFG